MGAAEEAALETKESSSSARTDSPPKKKRVESADAVELFGFDAVAGGEAARSPASRWSHRPPAPRTEPSPAPSVDIETMMSRQSRHLRDAEHITDEMLEEVKQLLRLFGIPYIEVDKFPFTVW